MIGTCVNQRYQIESELGQGGIGVVYLAHDILLKRSVAERCYQKQPWERKGALVCK